MTKKDQEESPYVDPLVKWVGGLAVFGVACLVIWMAIHAVIIMQIDNSTDYCHSAQSDMSVKDCKEVGDE